MRAVLNKDCKGQGILWYAPQFAWMLISVCSDSADATLLVFFILFVFLAIPVTCAVAISFHVYKHRQYVPPLTAHPPHRLRSFVGIQSSTEQVNQSVHLHSSAFTFGHDKRPVIPGITFDLWFSLRERLQRLVLVQQRDAVKMHEYKLKDYGGFLALKEV